jgi:hypothetical protein
MTFAEDCSQTRKRVEDAKTQLEIVKRLVKYVDRELQEAEWTERTYREVFGTSPVSTGPTRPLARLWDPWLS